MPARGADNEQMVTRRNRIQAEGESVASCQCVLEVEVVEPGVQLHGGQDRIGSRNRPRDSRREIHLMSAGLQDRIAGRHRLGELCGQVVCGDVNTVFAGGRLTGMKDRFS